MNFLSPLYCFTIGANLASYAGKNIKADQSALSSYYFKYMLAVVVLAVIPSNAYLLWHHPAWASFFLLFKDHQMSSSSAIAAAVAALALLDLLAAVIGFVAASARIHSSGHVAAHSLWQYTAVFYYGVLGLSYKAYTYTGTFREWEHGVPHDAGEFLNSPMFYALAASYAVIAPALIYPAVWWPSNQPKVAITEKEKNALDMRTGINYGMGLAVGVAAYAAVVALKGVELKSRLANDRFGMLTPLFSLFVGELMGALLFLWPVFDVPLAKLPSSMKKRSNLRKVKAK